MAIDLSSRASAIATDANGISHLVWVEGRKLWHTTYDLNSQSWQNAQAIADIGTDSVRGLNLIASDELIHQTSNPGAALLPGLVMVWQQGTFNNSEIYYTAAQYNSSSQLQWLASPVPVTADNVGDLEPQALLNNGTVNVVGQKVDFTKAANLGIIQDTDLYSQSFQVNAGQFSTLPTPAPAPSPYEPATSINGVIRGDLPISASPSAPANYQVLTTAETATVINGLGGSFQGTGFYWNGSQAFSSNNLGNWGLYKAMPASIAGLVKPFFNKVKVQGILQGSTNYDVSSLLNDKTLGLLLNAEALIVYRETRNQLFGKQLPAPVKVSGSLQTLYNFQPNPNTSGFFLNQETTVLDLSFNGKIPIYGDGAKPGFNVEAIFSAGFIVNAVLSPTNPATYSPPLTAGLTKDGLLIYLNVIPPLGSAAGIVTALGQPIIEIVDGAEGELQLNSFQLGFPVSAGIQAQFNVGMGGHLAQFTGNGQLSVVPTFGDPAASVTVGFPISGNVKLLNFINIGVGINPSWTWSTTPYNVGSNNNQSVTVSQAIAADPNPSSSELLTGGTGNIPTAAVQGSLLTLDFGTTALNSSVNVNPNQFRVTYINGAGQTQTVPVFGTVIQGNTVLLRLANVIPYTSLNEQPVSNTVVVSYTPSRTSSQNIQTRDGKSVSEFQNLAVANNTPQTLNYTYLPTAGDAQNYANTANLALIIFNVPLNTEVVPTASQFTVSGRNITVNSVLKLTENSVILSLSSAPTSNYTITYTPATSPTATPLLTATNAPIAAFNITSGSQSPTGPVNSTQALTTPVNPVTAIANDLAQDSPPSLAPTATPTQNLVAWASDAPQLAPVAAITDGNQIFLTFAAFLNNGLATKPSSNQFTVTVNGNSTSFTVTNVDLNGNSLILSLNKKLADSDSVSLSYALTSNPSNYANNLNFTDATSAQVWVSPFQGVVVDRVKSLAGPAPEKAVGLLSLAGNVSGPSSVLTIAFDQPLNTNSNPQANQFNVIVNNQSVAVSSVNINATSVSLTLGGNFQLSQGANVRVSYTANTSSLFANRNIRNTRNEAAGDFVLTDVLTTATSPSTIIKTAFYPSQSVSYGAIPGTSGLNFDQVAFYDQASGSNFLAWVNVDSSAFTNLAIPGQTYSPSQIAAIDSSFDQSSIYFSYSYTPPSGQGVQWAVAAPVPNLPAGVNQKVTLGLGPNNAPTLAWINVQPIGRTGNFRASIYTSAWNSTTKTWSTPQAIFTAVDPDPFTNLKIDSINNQPAIFWTETVPAGYAQAVSQNNPNIYLRLGELSGTTAQNVGVIAGASNGTFSGNYQLGQAGALLNPQATGLKNLGDPNPAVLFNSGGQVLVENIPVNGSDLSVEFWFKVPVLPPSGSSINLVRIPGLFSLTLNTTTGHNPETVLTFTLANDSKSTVQTNPVSQAFAANTWYYVVGTFSQGTKTEKFFNPNQTYPVLSLYVNGQPVGTTTGATFPNSPQSGNLILAGNNAGSVYLDEVALYNSSLTYSPININTINAATFTASDLITILGNQDQIGAHYSSRYNDPVPPGPQTYQSVWNPTTNTWQQTPSKIQPTPQPIPTQLANSISPVWDIVAATAAQANASINPNGNPDQHFQLTLTGQQQSTLTGLVITAGNTSWGIGKDNNGNLLSGNNYQQLGLVTGNTLINNPNTSPFSYPILSSNQTFDLFVDTGNSTPLQSATITAYLQSASGTALTPITVPASPIPPQSVATTLTPASPSQAPDIQAPIQSVLATGTVTEANDSSLALIDSGFIISANPNDNNSIGYVLASAFNPNGSLAYVAVGNRGYTNSNGNPNQGGTVQILFAGGKVLSNGEANPLTTTDLSGNPNGVLITGITDQGIAKSNFALSLATGNIDGDSIPDLVIGDANANSGNGAIYVIFGRALTQAQGSTINVANLNSTQGFVVNGGDPSGQAGYAVAVGNFGLTNNNTDSVVFGAPGALNGQGKVYAFSQQNRTPKLIYTGQAGEAAGYALGVSRRVNNGPTTYTGSTTTDDLIIGAPGHQATVSNQWSGQSGLPSSTQNLYPSSSRVSVGAVYIFKTSSWTPSTSNFQPLYSFIGPTLPPANGVAENAFAGMAVVSGVDLNGDGQEDLGIAAPGVNGGTGQIYLLSGNNPTKPLTPYNSSQASSYNALTQVSNLFVNGSIPGSQTGMVLSTPGDINADGYQDFLVTAAQAGNATGQSYLLFGGVNALNSNANSPNSFTLSPVATNNKTTFLMNGSQPFQLTGQAAIGVGDINNDSVDDLLVSAPGANQLYAVYGHPWLADDGSLKLANISGNNGFVIDGTLYNKTTTNPNGLSGAGKNVVMLGDINGDGFADVLPGGSPSGAPIIFGASTKDLLDAAMGTDDLLVTVNNGTIQSVVALGDFNGDGLADFGVLDGSNNFYLVLGNPGLGTQGTLSLTSPFNNSLANVTNAASTGDYNGDGYDDLIVNFSTGGRALYLGNISGTLTNSKNFSSPIFSLNYPFNGIGDINGDGYTDIGFGSGTANGNSRLSIGNNTSTLLFSSIINPPNAAIQGPPLTQNDWGFYRVPNLNSTNQTTSQLSNQTPTFAVFNGYLYMVFNSNTDNTLWIQRSADGYNWEGLTNLGSRFETKLSASLAVYNNTLYLAFATTETTPKLILAAATPDNSPLGLTFSQSPLITTGQATPPDTDSLNGGGPSLVTYNNQLYLFWTSTENHAVYISTNNPNQASSWAGSSSRIPDNNGNLQSSYSTIGTAVYGQTATNPGTLLVGFTGSNNQVNIASLNNGNWNSRANAISQEAPNGFAVSLVVAGNTAYLFFTKSGDKKILYSYSQTPTDLNSWQTNALPISSSEYTTKFGPGVTFFGESIYIGSTGTNSTLNISPSNPTFEPNITQQLGSQFQNIGDFNGDGFADFAVLAPGFISNLGMLNSNVQQNNSGAVFIYYGNNGNGTGKPLLTNPDVVLAVPPANGSTNVANNQVIQISNFAGAGDINGDGFDDLLIASPNTALDSANTTDGVISVVFGGPSSQWGTQYSATNPFNLGTLSPNTTTITLQTSQTLVTNSSPAPSQFKVTNGFAQNVSVTNVKVNTNSIVLTLNSPINTSYGTTVTYTYSSQTSGNVQLKYVTPTGNVAVSSGLVSSTSPDLASPGAPTIVFSGVNNSNAGFTIAGLPSSQAGISMAGGQDVNGDGFSDVIIGAPSNNDNLSFVIFGSDFTNQINQLGTIGDDVMVGTPTGETFIGGQGDDQIYTHGGLDVAYGGPGDDLITVSDAYFRRLDGGTGTNTLKFTGYTNQTWSLTTLAPGLRLRNFEVLDFQNYGSNQVVLNSLSVTQISPTNTLTLLLDPTDTLLLSNDFSFSQTTYRDSQRFYQYKSSTSAATVLVNQSTVPTYTASNINFPAVLPTISGNLTSQPMGQEPEETLEAGVAILNQPDTPTRLFVSNPTADESDGLINFTVQRSGDLSKPVLISYVTQDGNGKAGDRYLPTAGQILFAPNETTKTISVAIPNNNQFVGSRNFGLLVSLLAEGEQAGSLPLQFNVSALPNNGEQLRRWNLSPANIPNSLIGGFLQVESTATDDHAAIDLTMGGVGDFNTYWNFNPDTNSYQEIMFDGVAGARFIVDSSSEAPLGVEVGLPDDHPHDVDQVDNGLVKTQGFVGRTIPGLVTSNNKTFWAPTRADGEIQWRLLQAPGQDEFGVIAVDTVDGKINGLNPNDPGYLQAALARKQVIFANETGAAQNALTRAIALESLVNPNALVKTELQLFGEFQKSTLVSNQYYLFYSQVGEQVSLSVTNPMTVDEESRGYYQVALGDVKTEVGTSAIVIDGELNRPLPVQASLSRAAAFNNLVALYKVDSLTGGLDTDGNGIIDLRPGEQGYSQAALERVNDPLTGITLTTPENFATSSQSINLLGSNIYGTLIIPNATVDQVLQLNPNNQNNGKPVAFFSFGAANPDGITHMSRLGSNLFGFEDILGGGDVDYNDIILHLQAIGV